MSWRLAERRLLRAALHEISSSNVIPAQAGIQRRSERVMNLHRVAMPRFNVALRCLFEPRALRLQR
jgi:hypothetical protein